MAFQNAPYHAQKPPPPSSSSPRPCLCSPTTHPGSFRCSFHRIVSRKYVPRRSTADNAATSDWWTLSTSRKASALKALLLQIINPSNHRLRRRRNFQPRPSRFYTNSNTNGYNIGAKES
ncbi:PREDICTED: uncharacterized protein LOC104815293 [Tarenaya hassleriana]|uniref:uncharacterized protein LOC104815293 n=1 Tax=Tarenaya hassleriana TaxID=28532 RepID=UPI00053C730F|nr:PREDICTED: uncharacterized protein LOC104815293 [Tarenaya hassleriana]